MKNKKVELYSTPTCHFCHMTKDFFKAHDIRYTDYNVAINLEKRSEMVERSGQLGVPVIVIEDKEVIVGFDRNRLAELLEISA